MTGDPTQPAVAQPGARDRLGLLARGEGVITGTVVCAAVIAAVGATAETTRQLTVALLGTSFIYWLAHLHAHAIASAIKDQAHPLHALKHAAEQTWTILAASLVPIVILVIAEIVGADLRDAAQVALYAIIGLLAVYSYLGGRRGGLDVKRSLACAVAGAALGVLVALLKAFALH